YDVNDGLGVQTITKEEVIRTFELTVPTVGINFVSISDSQIIAKIVSSDVDNILNIDEIQLFKGSSLINTYDVSDLNENNELIITTISNTEYTFVVKYSYSLDGGTNIQNSVYQSTVISSKEVPIISLAPYFTSQNSLSYNLLISDPNASGHVQMISLYSGSTFIKRLSESTTTIDSLDSNTQYSIKVNYVYDFDDGLGSREINYSYNFTTLKQEPVISLSSTNVTKNSIEFSYDLVDVDNALRLEKLELFNNNILIQTYTEWNQNVFNDLLSNNEYKIIGTFIKNINTGDEIVTRSLSVKTNSLEIPSVDIHLTSTRDEVSYEYALNDPDKVSELSSIDIYYQGNKLDNQSTDNVFSDLFTDSFYEVVITLLCDYRDGKLPKEERYTKMIKTESYNVPNVNLDLTSTEETINYQIVYSDPFNLINPTKINIYKDDEIVQEIANFEIKTIDNLLSNTLYTIELVYEYNLNDNRGTITEYYRRSYSTLAYNVKVKNFTVLNELTPKTNEDINILINIENKSNVKVEYVIVNGVKKQISGGDFYNSIIIIERSPKISGNYQLVVSKMGYILNGIEVEQEVESDIEISIEIMSRLDIISCSIVNDSSVYKNIFGTGLVVTIDNPYNYEICEYLVYSNNTSSTNGCTKYIPVKMIDNNHVYINLNLFYKYVRELDFKIKGVKYIDENGNLTERKYDQDLVSDIKVIEVDYQTNALVVHQINTIDDFINMFNDPYGIYELTTDLDFTGYTWVSRDFYGYFDGRGHKLSNISIIEENEYNSTQYVGIFKDCNNSVIKNVYFENLYMNVDTSNSVNSYIINASGTPILSNILISGNINFKPTSSSVLYYPTGTNIYYVDHLNYNSQKYTGNNLISLEQYNSKEFIENVLKWDFKEKEKENYNGLLYTIYQNSYIIIDGYNGTNADLVIPESINGLPVIGIADLAFENNTLLKSIVFPDTLLFIGASTLKGCYNLEELTIKEVYSFLGDHLMKSLFGSAAYDNSYWVNTEQSTAYVPNKLKTLNISTNYNIDEIKTWYWSEFNFGTFDYNIVFYNLYSLENVTFDYPMFNQNMFGNCTNLRNFTILSEITSIGDSAFYGCSSLTSITIPEGVTSIGDHAFRFCSSLISITIPKGVTSIGDHTFCGCSSLTSITIPEGVTSIGIQTFRECSSLTSITIPEGVTSIGNQAFYNCSSLTSITIPEGVTSIGDSAFSGCSSLTSITIPEGVTSIGDYAFSNCSSLTSITIPEGVTSIGSGVFGDCSSLTSIIIPEGVTSIGDYAFSNCSS
ncbi:MAG: leucine-rich repeat domain-containing protein, partial [Bacilli bacterium]